MTFCPLANSIICWPVQQWNGFTCHDALLKLSITFWQKWITDNSNSERNSIYTRIPWHYFVGKIYFHNAFYRWLKTVHNVNIVMSDGVKSQPLEWMESNPHKNNVFRLKIHFMVQFYYLFNMLYFVPWTKLKKSNQLRNQTGRKRKECNCSNFGLRVRLHSLVHPLRNVWKIIESHATCPNAIAVFENVITN